MPHSKRIIIGFWSVTALFCLQMSFTAYAELRLPQVAESFTRLGFPAYFRVELAWAKLLGVAVLLAPVPARIKEWVYAGFAITLASALIAHLSIGEGPEAWGWAVGTAVLCRRGTRKELAVPIDWLRSLPHAAKVVVAGNHDWPFVTTPDVARAALGPGIAYLEDRAAQVAGLRFWGSPWQPAFCDWAFNLP